MISTTEQTKHNGYGHSEGTACTPAAQGFAAAAVVDLCSGMGGLSLAAKNIGMQVVAGVDINTSALKTFGKNFPGAKAIDGSVRSKTVLAKCADLLKPFKAAGQSTVIISGPPCQGFSPAGTRDPADPRNQVLVAVARAISTLKPTCAVIENVSMVLANKHGNRIDNFERILNLAGFKVTSVVLDASAFGVPSNLKLEPKRRARSAAPYPVWRCGCKNVVFQAISQSEGFDFSPVATNAGNKFFWAN